MSSDGYPPCSNVFGGTVPLVHCLGRVDSMWLLVTAEAGTVSAIAILGVYIYIFRNIYRYRRRTGGFPDLTKRPMDVYLLSLFTADLVHSIAEFVSFKWVDEGNVHVGNACNLQGIMISLGSNSIATSTFAITIHTLSVAWFGKGAESGRIAIIAVMIAWLYILIFNITLVATHKNLASLYAPTPSWCAIANDHEGYKIANEYLWLWISLATSFLVYIPLSFMTQGYFTVDPNKWWKIRTSKLTSMLPHRSIFYSMIVYPIIYSIIALPFNIVRWKSFTKMSNPTSQLITKAVWNLSGVLDVILFLMTRRDVLTFRDLPVGHLPEPRVEDGENREAEQDNFGRLPEPAGVWPEHDIEESESFT